MTSGIFRKGLLLLGTACSTFAWGHAPDGARGEQIYVICGACHGPLAQGEQRLEAPGLAGQPKAYLLRQLRDFRDGARGGAGDAEGQQMRQILDAIPGEDDWTDVVEYIGSLAPRAPAATLHGDIDHGRKVYATCGPCHGSAAEGNETLSAPPLRWLPDWYIAEQLRKFRLGQRGSASTDVPGSQMRGAAQVLRSDKEILAVSSFLGNDSNR